MLKNIKTVERFMNWYLPSIKMSETNRKFQTQTKKLRMKNSIPPWVQEINWADKIVS